MTGGRRIGRDVNVAIWRWSRAVISEWERPLRQNGATDSHKEAETAAVPMVTGAMRGRALLGHENTHTKHIIALAV